MTAKTLPGASSRVKTLLNLLEPVYGLPGASSAMLEAIEPEPAPDPRGAVWLAFTGDHNADAETVPCASPGAAVREVRPVPEVTPCE